MSSLERDALKICAEFGLRYRSLEPERANVKRRYGICYDDGTIKIRLRHATTGEALKYSSLINTLCHELAHLRHFDHSPRFQAYYLKLLAWARRQGIYQPQRVQRPDRTVAAHAPVPTLPTIGEATAASAPGKRVRPRAPASGTPLEPMQLSLF